jgi:hypothetical protein
MLGRVAIGVMIVVALLIWRIDPAVGVLIFLAAMVLLFSSKRRKQS